MDEYIASPVQMTILLEAVNVRVKLCVCPVPQIRVDSPLFQDIKMSENEVFTKYEKGFIKGTVIFNDGDKSKEMYIIKAGRVEITKKVYDEVISLGTLEKGDFFGEVSTFIDEPRTATVTAIVDSILIVVHPDIFQDWMTDNPRFGTNVVRALCERLFRTNKQLETLTLQNLLDKVIIVLYNEVTDGGRKLFKKGVNLDMKTMLKLLVQQTNLREETVVKLLQQLVQMDMIHVIKSKSGILIQLTDKIDQRILN